ncbi:MAG: ABC transporter ATP-binding protein, partial [Chloroflexi bacterium]|nr:ABC transporter ATP-binding protein [Chloroflexota bacterium]
MPENARLIGLKLRKAVRQLQYLLRALALVYSAARVWTVIWLVLLVLQGVLPAAQVVLTRALINGIVQALGGDVTWRALGPVLTTAIAVGLLILLAELLRTGSNWIRSVEGDIIQDHISSLVLRHSAQLDLAFYDSPDYYDRLHRARVEASYRPLALFESLGGLLQNAITFLSMLTVLVPYGPWLPLVLLASTLPALYVVLQQTVREHEWRQKTTADERRSWYYFGLLTAREAVPELRLFGLGEHFYALYNGIRRALRGQRASLIRAQAVSQFVAATFAILAAGGVLLWMGARALRGQATLGDLALFYQAFTQGQGLMRTLLHNMGQIYGHSLFLGNLFEFLALEPRITDPPAPEPLVVPLKEGIRFCDVRFRYPG